MSGLGKLRAGPQGVRGALSTVVGSWEGAGGLGRHTKPRRGLLPPPKGRFQG